MHWLILMEKIEPVIVSYHTSCRHCPGFL